MSASARTRICVIFTVVAVCIAAISCAPVESPVPVAANPVPAPAVDQAKAAAANPQPPTVGQQVVGGLSELGGAVGSVTGAVIGAVKGGVQSVVDAGKQVGDSAKAGFQASKQQAEANVG